MKIRLANTSDSSRLAEIYAPYCETPISFEGCAPDAEEMTRRLLGGGDRFPWLVAEGEIVLGYAYASPHRSRASYGWSVETSIYLDQNFRKRGLGQELYSVLLELLRRQGFRTALAGVTLPNPASIGLHTKLGFQECALYAHVGYKNGAWQDVQWLSLDLNPDLGAPQPLRLVTDITGDGFAI